jgi:hypothetical protein
MTDLRLRLDTMGENPLDEEAEMEAGILHER